MVTPTLMNMHSKLNDLKNRRMFLKRDPMLSPAAKAFYMYAIRKHQTHRFREHRTGFPAELCLVSKTRRDGRVSRFQSKTTVGDRPITPSSSPFLHLYYSRVFFLLADKQTDGWSKWTDTFRSAQQ